MSPRSFSFRRMTVRSSVALALLAGSIACAQAAGLQRVVVPGDTDAVGSRSWRVPAPGREAPLDVTLWYPAGRGGVPVDVGGNAVFVGTPAMRDAPIASGPHPLVLVSHGGGGNPGQHAWIANELVAAGFVVAAPAHPGSTTGNASPMGAVRLWLRPTDVSATLSGLLDDATFGPHLQEGRVAALGFSAGGHTVLSLVGARTDPAALASFCDGGGGGMSDCAFLARGGIDLHALDLAPAGADLADARITAAVVIDPGTVGTLVPSSLAAIDVPVAFLNLGSPEEVPGAVDASEAARLVPGATHANVPGASHFAFLPECTDRGAALLVEEGEPDALCEDGGDTSRASLHREIAARVRDALGRDPR